MSTSFFFTFFYAIDEGVLLFIEDAYVCQLAL